MSSVEEIERLLTDALAPTELDVVDVSASCGSAFDVSIVSAKFTGVGRLQRHRMVHDALGDVMSRVHAMKIDAKAP